MPDDVEGSGSGGLAAIAAHSALDTLRRVHGDLTSALTHLSAFSTPAGVAQREKGAASTPLSPRGLPSDDEDATPQRPALYPTSHRPRAHLDGIEGAQHRWEHRELLDALRLDEWEGAYNLGAFVLAFMLMYALARSVKERGLLLGASDDACPEARRDARDAAVVCACAAAWSSLAFVGVRRWACGAVSWTALARAYALGQAVLLGAPIVALQVVFPLMSPLPAGAAMLVILVLALKAHSYVATNFAMAMEHEKRWGAAGESAPPASPTRELPLVASTPPSTPPLVRADAQGGGLSVEGTSSLSVDTSSHIGVDTAAGVVGAVDGPLLRRRRGGGVELPSGNTALDEGGEGDALASAPFKGTGSRGSQQRLIHAWPSNVTLKDWCYFIAAPSLVYEPRFPRTRSVRWWYAAGKAAEGGVAVALQYAIARQFLLPTLTHPTSAGEMGWGGEGALLPRTAYEGIALGYDVMCLAVPSLFVFLLGFYAVFHCALNALAEVTRFADRRFFSDWWNATTLSVFWRKWNGSVHEWALRHVYVELQEYHGASRRGATFATFLVSALAHELILSVAFRTAAPFFFLGMLLQLPLIACGRASTGGAGRRRGNLIVWASLFAGQPLLELLYARVWYATHDTFFCVSKAEVSQ